MNIFKYSIQLLVIGLLFANVNVARAQLPSSGKVQVKFACARINNGQSKLSYSSKKSRSGTETLQLSLNYLSNAVLLTPDKNGKVNLYDSENLPTKGQPVKPVVSFKVPSASKNLLVLLLPAQKGNGVTYNAKLISAADGFDFGSSCIVNMTAGDIYLKENDKGKPRKIAKGGNRLVGVGHNQSKVMLGMQKGESKSVSRFYSATWTFSPDVREICLIYKKPGKKWPTTKVISESRPVRLN